LRGNKLVWVSYQKPKKNRDAPGKDHPRATLLVVIIGTPLAMAAAYGAFGSAMQLIGILVSVPLLFLAIHLVMFAPWIALMWLGAFISHRVRRKRNMTRTKQIPFR
jgi:hypothetical protein